MATQSKEVREFIEQLAGEIEGAGQMLLKRPSLSPFLNNGVWVSFLVMGTDMNGYICDALVFAEPSRYGIEEGRVSKLTVIDEASGKQVFHFDRGHREGKAPAGIVRQVAGTFPHQTTSR